MKKVVCILGSPRKSGSTATIAARFLEVAEAQGAEIRSFHLNSMSYKGCQGCMACKRGSEECVLKDDLSEALTAARESDVLVMASPIYFGDMTAQIKAFIDRSYSFLKPTYLTEPNPTRLAPGKTCVFILTQGCPDESTFDIFSKYEMFFSWYGFDNHLIRGVGLSADNNASDRPELLARAEALAKEILGYGISI